jgi:hypothetical protein
MNKTLSAAAMSALVALTLSGCGRTLSGPTPAPSPQVTWAAPAPAPFVAAATRYVADWWAGRDVTTQSTPDRIAQRAAPPSKPTGGLIRDPEPYLRLVTADSAIVVLTAPDGERWAVTVVAAAGRYLIGSVLPATLGDNGSGAP